MRDPSFEAWSAEIELRIAELDSGAVIVGHSIGGTILIHLVARQPRLLRRIDAVCLVSAPFVGEGGWQSDELLPEQDWADPLSSVAVFLYQGDADATIAMTHLDLYARAIPHAHVRRLGGRDHQLNDDLSEVAEDILRVSQPG